MSLENVKNTDIFNGIDDKYRDRILHNSQVIELAKNEFLFRQGDIGKGMYFLVSGTVEVIGEKKRSSGENITKVLAEMGPGSYFGEVCMLVKQLRTASIKAKVDSQLLYLEAKSFQEDIGNEKIGAYKLGYNIAQLLADRLRKAIENIMTIQESQGDPKGKSELEKLREQLMTESLF